MNIYYIADILVCVYVFLILKYSGYECIYNATFSVTSIQDFTDYCKNSCTSLNMFWTGVDLKFDFFPSF